jgi:hypothetical protein
MPAVTEKRKIRLQQFPVTDPIFSYSSYFNLLGLEGNLFER